MADRNGSWPRYRSRRLDTVLNIVRLLAGPELDDAKVCETVEVEGIFLDDGFDLLPIPAHSQDDPTLSRYLSARDEEIAGGGGPPTCARASAAASKPIRPTVNSRGFLVERDTCFSSQTVRWTPSAQWTLTFCASHCSHMCQK